MSSRIKNSKVTLILSALIAFLIASLTPDVYFLSYLYGIDKSIILLIAVSAIIIILVYTITKPKAFLKHTR
jgi:hypothetical protein